MHTRTTRIAAFSGGAGLTALFAVAGAAPAVADGEVERPDSFTSAYTVHATPDEVVDSDGTPAPGEPGAMGTYTFMINSDEEIICYDITLTGVTPPYESPARTATHIHQAGVGEAGPPRLAFEDPEGEGEELTSTGCIQGPFTTGLEGDDGADTAEGFSLKEIEADPAAFSADTHTAEFVPGAVRGQLEEIPVGGVDTGFGGAADEGSSAAVPLVVGLGALGAASIGTVAVLRRRRDDAS